MKISQLTGTRFIAAFSIVLFHFGKDLTPAQSGYLPTIFGPLNFAVSYFFALSGFILYVVHGEATKSQTRFEFYRARFARIYPLYFLAWLFVSVPKFSHPYLGFMGDFFSGLFLLQSWIPGKALVLNGPAWSLSVEAFFYFLFPFVVPFIRSRSLLRTGIWVTLFWLASQFLYSQLFENWPTAIYFPPLHLSSFIVGMYFGRIYLSMQRQAPLSTSQANAYTLFSLALWFSLQRLPWMAAHGHNGLMAPIIGCFLVFLSSIRGQAQKILSLSWLVLLGEISYGIYILQIPVYNNWFVTFQKHPGLLSPAMDFYGYVGVLILFSYLMYRFVERPTRRAVLGPTGNKQL